MTSASIILSDAVQVKTEPVDTDVNLPTETQERNNTWVKVKDTSLTNYDKDLLVHGEKLSDKHINLAHRILKLQFPKINGLRLTLLQDKPHKEPTDNALLFFILVVTIGFVLQPLELQERKSLCSRNNFDVQQAVLPS